MGWHKIGTVAVTNGSTTVTGTGTLWSLYLTVGDLFTLDGDQFYEIQAIPSNTELTLAAPFLGETASGASYAVITNLAAPLQTQVLQQYQNLLTLWMQRESEMVDWLSGTGSVTIHRLNGTTVVIKTPAQLQADVDAAVAELESYGIPALEAAAQAAAASAQQSANDAAAALAMAGDLPETLATVQTAQTDIVTRHNDIIAKHSTVASNTAAVIALAATVEADATSATDAAANATAASTSAQQFASHPVGTVIPGRTDYSALHYAAEAAADQADVATKHADVTTKHADVATKHSQVVADAATVATQSADVTTKHADVVAKHGQVVTDAAAVATDRTEVGYLAQHPEDQTIPVLGGYSALHWAKKAEYYAGIAAQVTEIGPASETVAGIIELATQAEVDAGTDTIRAVTPARLAASTVFDSRYATPAAVAAKQNADATLTALAALTGAGYIKASATDTFAMVASVPWTDLSGVPASFTPSPHTHPVSDISSLASYTGFDARYYTESEVNSLLAGKQTADATLTALAGIAGTSGYIKCTGTDTFTLAGVAWGDLSGVPSTFTPSAHSHSASDIISGVLAIARIPTGTSGTTVALGNHTHTGVYQPLDADLTAIAALAGTSGFLKKTAANTWALDTTSYAATGHTHSTANISDLASYTGFDARYYTESEVNSLLSAKASLTGPAFTGSPTTTTPASNATGTQIANAAWVRDRIRHPREYSITTANSVTPVALDEIVTVTALAQSITLNPPSGVTENGTPLLFRITSTGSYNISYNAAFRAVGVTLPTTIASGVTQYIACLYNANAAKWDVVAVPKL